MMTRRRFFLYGVAFWAGVLLLGCNVYGLIVPNDQRDAFSDLGLLPYAETLALIEAVDAADVGGVEELNAVVHESMAFQWPVERTRVPVRQNWLLWSAAWADPLLVRGGLTNVPDLFRHYQFLDHRRGLERGFGICSQMALVLAGFVEERLGLDVDIVSLGGHVVAQVRLPDGTAVLADPSKGVVLPFDLKRAEQFPAKTIACYPPGSSIPELYDPDGNEVVPGGPAGYNPKLHVAERASFILIWVIPALLVLVGLGRRRRA